MGSSARSDSSGPSWGRRAVWVAAGVVVAIMLYLIGAAVLPRWWAQRVASVVDGSLTVGALYGLFIGFVFTALPLGSLALAVRLRRRVRSWKGWAGWLVAAAVLAAPNLMTLGVTLGNGDAAHDGDRILSVEATGFRTWSVVGAALAGVVAVALGYLVTTRGWFKDQNRRLRRDAGDR